MAKFFRFPFALIGDRTAIPDESQPSGAVSYNQGFGPDYERDPTSDPLAKRVPRNETNQYLYDITDNIRDYQLWGSPAWVTAAENGGAPVSYGNGAQVRYDAGAGVLLWQSIVANNTATPGSDDTKWVIAAPFNFTTSVASQAEIQAGTVNNKIVTPLGLTYRTATTTRTGIAAIATNAEIATGTETAKIVTPAGLASRSATEALAGLVALATTAEVLAGTNSGKAITPAGLVNRTATTTRTGIAALASQAEVIAGTDAEKIVTSATLHGKTATTARIGLAQIATLVEAIAGAVADKFITPAVMRSYSFGGPDYRWQSFIASRTTGTTYQNTYTRPIAVSITCGDDAQLQVSIDGTTWVVLTITQAGGDGMFGIIPPSQYYRQTGAGRIVWAEMVPNT